MTHLNVGFGPLERKVIYVGQENSNRSRSGGIGTGSVEGFLEEGYNRLMASPDLRLTSMPLNNGAGFMPALGFGTLIPDAALTRTATRDALDAGFRHFDCAER